MLKALLTAGGHGTRLRPITNTINKHLIPIANRPMIYYPLQKIARAGIKEVAININPGDKELPAALGDGSRWGLNITYIEQKGGPLGLAHIIKNAANWIGQDDLLFYLGDNILLGEVKPFVDEFYKQKVNCLLLLAKVPDPQRFGVPVIENGRIVRVEEKPAQPKSNFAVTGLYIYDNHILEAVNVLKPSARGELEISDAHTYLIERGYQVGFKEVTGWWKDTGKPEDLLEGNGLILSALKESKIEGEIDDSSVVQGKVIIGAGTKISKKTVIRGPVIIGTDCVIANSYIGPYTSIGNRVEIYNSEIENTIVFDEADINCRQRIVDSLIGLNAMVIPASDTWPSGHKLIIGDQSVVEL